MTALALSHAGLAVTVLERSGDTGRTGAAILVEERLLERIVGPRLAMLGEEVPAGVQTWFTVHDGLREAVGADPNIRCYSHADVVTVGQDEKGAWATTRAGNRFHSDIVVGADGHRSVVRAHVCPQDPHARFARYLVWLGVAQESALPSKLRWPVDVAYLESSDFILLGYPLPGADGSSGKGARQLGWAWYDASRNGLLEEKGCVAGNVVHHTLRPGEVPKAVYRDLAALAGEHWPKPWLDAILECVGRRAVIGTPIAEYIPARLTRGRIALVGDAAHVPTPMTGRGFGASLQDALALADALSNGVRGDAALEALCRYEQQRLLAARSLVKTGQQFSRSFAPAATVSMR